MKLSDATKFAPHGVSSRILSFEMPHASSVDEVFNGSSTYISPPTKIPPNQFALRKPPPLASLATGGR